MPELCVRCTKKTEDVCKSCGRMICSTCMGISEVYCVDCERVMGIDIIGEEPLTRELARKKASDYLFNTRMDKACVIVPMAAYLKAGGGLKNDEEKFYGVITSTGVMPVEAMGFYRRRMYQFEHRKERWAVDVENFIRSNESLAGAFYVLDESGELDEIKKRKVMVKVLDSAGGGEIRGREKFRNDVFSSSGKWVEAGEGDIEGLVGRISFFVNSVSIAQALEDADDRIDAARHLYKSMLAVELALVFAEKETVARNIGGCVDLAEMAGAENPFAYLSERVADVVYSLAEASGKLSESQKKAAGFLRRKPEWADSLRELEHIVRGRDGMVRLALSDQYEKQLYKLCENAGFKLSERDGSAEPWGLYRAAMRGIEFERRYYLQKYREAYRSLTECGFLVERNGFAGVFEERQGGRPRKDTSMVVLAAQRLSSDGLSTREIANRLRADGHSVSHVTVSRILKNAAAE
ncbi:MAG: helix-turn-helix domain-containing protein [archaeon]